MSHVIAEQARRKSDTEYHTGPYVFRNLLTEVVLSEDGHSPNLYITCVDFWNGNLYVGSSGGQILHYVLIPAGDGLDQPAQFILATRLQLSPTDGSSTASVQVGVQQILILPSVDKACIVCNGSLTFYALPELSPLFTTTKLGNCLWVGGLDEDEEEVEEADSKSGREVIIMVCQKSRVRLVKIGERLRAVREIEIKGCSKVVRRGNIACIADMTSYSLLDVVEKQRISLFDIASTVDDKDESTVFDSNIQDDSRQILPNSGSDQQASTVNHIAELNGLTNATTNATDTDADPKNQQLVVHQSESDFPTGLSSLQSQSQPSTLHDNSIQVMAAQPSPIKLTTATTAKPPEVEPRKSKGQIRPLIVSPSTNEFLLTIGTSMDDPGVGMFVNLDGEVVRGTLDFNNYPEALCVDIEHIPKYSVAEQGQISGEDFVLAVTSRNVEGEEIKSIEIQAINSQTSDSSPSKHWLDIDFSSSIAHHLNDPRSFPTVGMRLAVSSCDVLYPEIAQILVLKRITLTGISKEREKASSKHIVEKSDDRDKSEADFIRRLSSGQGRILLWNGDRIWWALRNSKIVRMDAQLSLATTSSQQGMTGVINGQLIEQLNDEIQGQEAQTELDFLGFKYIRQRASLLLFTNIVSNNLAGSTTHKRDWTTIENALSAGEVDPRLVLAILPGLRNEIVVGEHGIWIQNGLKRLIEEFITHHDLESDRSNHEAVSLDILHLTKRYLQTWRHKKGFGSISDEKEVFETVDAALLQTLLILDSTSPRGPIPKGSKSIRAELYAVVDHGVDCFERGVEILESFHRLYVLSRLYQSRKMSGRVLATWRRIIEGEHDTGGELVDGEQEVGRYLSKISDVGLVEEYGAWLASRNPKLGVRVFADNNNKVKIPPSRVVEILKSGAPNTVKEFLEHLVFDKNLASYANDLITYYLDSVLAELESSELARSSIIATYVSYRALRAPKPPYSQFAADNTVNAVWYRNRLRLLQLLGGSHGAASQYDVSAILARIEPFQEELVPEMIVLSGRQGKHKEAIRLLTHGLGDFDTAVSYCVLGGSSTYSSLLGTQPRDFVTSREEQMALFQYLLEEFLRIKDSDDKITQTSELLERFAGWFDVSHVLTLIPEAWSVDLLSNFLESALRQLVTERNETVIARALTSVENIVASATLIEKIDSFKPRIEYEIAAQNIT